jgi:hypothetical protein
MVLQASEMFDGIHRFHAIGHARGIAKIDDILERQAFHQRPHHRQATYAGIEHANRMGGQRIHGKPLRSEKAAMIHAAWATNSEKHSAEL